ncbi:hypothetical protein HYFRA_00008037 [Hymenoscyphus fraxineus]|uniref:Uncharacterized protein n=1 Tax=Hymenoscyphus fraxineus TaxID=746836 RepID=A0A9N9KQN3_9HELO|nr:hypothetical protein HYFRA_00008037 [Hymenoscyphus fraxineus]
MEWEKYDPTIFTISINLTQTCLLVFHIILLATMMRKVRRADTGNSHGADNLFLDTGSAARGDTPKSRQA